MGAVINVGNVTLNANVYVNFASAASTYATGGLVRTITTGSGALLDFQTQTISTAAGTGLIKNGDGVLALGGGAYNGGFTLNAGTVIARAVDAFGANASNVLTLNGGTVASDATRSFANTKHGGGIVIGGNIQFGELATVLSIASSSANLSFANNVSLGNATRTLTQGNNGTNTFSGIIANTSGGITFAANVATDGRFELTNTANTFTGDINITGGEVRFTADASLGNAANDIIIDGGRFATGSGVTYTLGGGRQISIGDGVGTSISTPGAGTLTYNGVLADKTSEVGSWAKQGGGTLALGGANTYTGSTSVNNGILRLTTGNNRLPTGTVFSLGQAASANVGTLDLNGFNQEVAGLSSTAGTNATANRNTVTSIAAATLTVNTTGTYTYSAGTAANSGNISGAISFVKSGAGTQILGGSNAYTGTTTIEAGRLLIGGQLTATAFTQVSSGGAIGGNGTIASSLDFASGAKFVFSLTDTLKVNGSSVSFGGFSIADLLGLNNAVANGTYSLIGGSAVTSLTNVSNVGLINAASIGGDKTAYFQGAGLQVVVVPEPSTALSIVIGAGALLGLRRKRRNA